MFLFFLKSFYFYLNYVRKVILLVPILLYWYHIKGLNWSDIYFGLIFFTKKFPVLTGVVDHLYPLHIFWSRPTKYQSYITILTTKYANVKQMLSSFWLQCTILFFTTRCVRLGKPGPSGKPASRIVHNCWIFSFFTQIQDLFSQFIFCWFLFL